MTFRAKQFVFHGPTVPKSMEESAECKAFSSLYFIVFHGMTSTLTSRKKFMVRQTIWGRALSY